MQALGISRLQLLSNQVNARKPKMLESAWDFLNFDEFLTPQERTLRKQFREQIMKFNERVSLIQSRCLHTSNQQKCPLKWQCCLQNQRDLMNKFPIQGMTFKGYGCRGISFMAAAAIVVELHRADGSLAAYILAHIGLAMRSIYNLGTEEQKARFLPDLATFKKDACWALTQPGRGSDASGMKTQAKPTEGGFILNGTKRWIGNATHADVFIIFARNTESKKVQAFILTKEMKGISTKKIHGKWGFRSVQNGEIYLRDVFVPNDMVLPKGEDFSSVANLVLRPSRLFISWGLIGLAIGCWDAMMRFIKDKKSMGKPLVKHQLVQEKITRALAQIQSILFLAKRGTDLFEQDNITIGQVSLIKAYASMVARDVAALCRQVMGGDGIIIQNQIMKHMNDIEVLYTGEGTYDINMMVAGREITGHSAFK